MPRERKPQKDRTSLIIAALLHVVLIGGIAYWAWKTGKLEQIRQAVLQYVKGEKKEEKKPEPVQQKQAAPPKLPPINQGMPQTQGSGTRRAVASDAPEAHGGQSFFQDTRKQASGPSTGAAPARQTNAPVVRLAPPPAPRPTFAPPPKTTIKQLLAERAREAASVEAVGTEQIAKTASTDAGAILSRVSGASIVEGKFAVIRGLTDRYVSTTLNGADIPSADPYRRSASLDQFPAQVIDKVVVSKTFTPDKPGTFTGGGIDIVTRSFPTAPFASASIGAAYNDQATFNDRFLTYDGGGRDWLGMDDGSRALPSLLKNLNVDIPVQPTSANPNTPLGRQNIEKADFIERATIAMGVTQFAPTREAPPPDHSFALSAGDTTYFLGRPAGIIASVNYRHEYRFQEDEVARRWKAEPASQLHALSSDYSDNLSADTVNWSAMESASIQWLDDHEFGVTFLYNQNGQKIARVQDEGFSDSQPGATFVQNRLQWIERSLQTLQLKGVDRFSALADLRLDWVVALTETSQEEPDTRFFNYYRNGDIYTLGSATLPTPQDPTRYFRDLEEDNLNPKVDLTLPFRQWSALPGEFKAGWFLSSSERTFSERQIFYETLNDSPPFLGDPNKYLTPDNLGYNPSGPTNRTFRFNWQRFVQNADSTYDGTMDVQAAYAMLDFPATEKLRLIGGARLESTDIHIDSVSYIGNGVTGLPVNQTDLQQTDALPAVGLIYSITERMNLRLSYSQTIARPSFRELAAFRQYDPVLDVEADGNPRLVLSSIENYDLRWEWFPRPGDLLSVSLFYKSLKNPIERYSISADDKLITYINRDSGTSMGIEFEARTSLDRIHSLLSEFSLGANLTLIESETELTDTEFSNKTDSLGKVDRTRPLYDTSPYLANVDLSYDNIHSGTSASLVFNVAGPRIVFASQSKEDVYEQPAPVLDFVISQKIGRSLTVRFTAKNLLNPVIKRTYGEDEEDFKYSDPNTFETKSLPNLYSTSTRGITFGLSASYDF